jgi:tetratricopeptide (TPR) repeat protein
MTSGTEADRQRALLRQLRDLDDDLAAGKLTDADHERLRAPLEREAAAALRTPRDPAAAARRSDPARARGSSRRRRLALAAAAVAGSAAVVVLLVTTAAPRTAGGTATGDAPAVAATPAAAPDGSAAAPAGPPGAAAPPAPGGSAQPSMTAEQAAAIDSAALAVKAHPQDVGTHLTLAHAYAAGGATQLAAVEYLAILTLDPPNAEANTQLALLAFEVGQPQQAKTMLDRAITADPDYPEALYVRGLVLLSGLHRKAAAAKDLHAYLAAAPYGSHRTAAETLLALAGGTP